MARGYGQAMDWWSGVIQGGSRYHMLDSILTLRWNLLKP